MGYIEGSEGAAQQIADSMESGHGGSFRTLKSAVEGTAISFGERPAPMVQKAVEKITAIVNWLSSPDDKTKDTIIKIAAVSPVGIVNGWTNIKNGVKGAWDSVLGVIKSPIESAKTWLREKSNSGQRLRPAECR